MSKSAAVTLLSLSTVKCEIETIGLLSFEGFGEVETLVLLSNGAVTVVSMSEDIKKIELREAKTMVEQVEFTNMCMICDGSKVVVIDRKKKDWPGITFPGGKVELGESFSDSVIREVKEETGLHINSPRLCGIKDWYENQQRYVVLFYKTSNYQGLLQSSDEGKVWWEEIDNLPNLSLSLDMDDMLRVFTEDDLSEFFYRQDGGKWVYDLK